MNLTQSVLDEIRLLVACGFENHESLYLHIFETMGEELGLTDEVTTIADLDPTTSLLLRRAIEEAFSRRTEESRSWPSTTDCDRLRRSFHELDKQGIVALENCGATQEDGVYQAALVAVARDELGHVANNGYCFFHHQDTIDAVEGDGLSLTFGTFTAESPESAQGPSAAACPTCNGRGWIQPDPSNFAEPCPNHLATPAAKPPMNPAQQVGEAVVKACRDVGLEVEWNGSPDTRIHLRPFRWQRRVINSSESDIGEFLASWELEIRAGYKSPNELLATLDERAGDWFADFADFGPRLLDRLRDHTERLLEKEQAREDTWTEATINDRITAAFEDLRGRRILARECLGLTIQDGWGYAGLEASTEHRGVVFFHHEDVIDGVSGLGVLLAYGALGVDASKDDKATLALGQEIMATLEEHGVPCSWSKSVHERIRIAPFDWRRRRWTNAPSHERRPATASNPASLWSRVFGGSSRGRPAGTGAGASVRQFSEVVRAVRDEGGFDLRRAKRMRGAWKSLGRSDEAQVGHLGVPHVFVRAGEFTTMVPVSAVENLREEKNEIFARAAEAKKSQA